MFNLITFYLINQCMFFIVPNDSELNFTSFYVFKFISVSLLFNFINKLQNNNFKIIYIYYENWFDHNFFVWNDKLNFIVPNDR